MEKTIKYVGKRYFAEICTWEPGEFVKNTVRWVEIEDPELDPLKFLEDVSTLSVHVYVQEVYQDIFGVKYYREKTHLDDMHNL